MAPRKKKKAVRKTTSKTKKVKKKVGTPRKRAKAAPDPEKTYPFLNGIRHPKKRAFLISFCETFNVSRSARHCEMGRQCHYFWLENDPIYAAAFEKARPIAAEALEAELTRRAFQGVERLKFHQGNAIMVPCKATHPDALPGERQGEFRRLYIEHEYSDTLGIFLMKGAMPEKYRERVDVQESNDQLIAELEAEITETPG